MCVFATGRQEHFCMSAMGVMTVVDGEETEFCLLGEWNEEESNYNMLKQLRFFKYFAHNKFLSIWRHEVRPQPCRAPTYSVPRKPFALDVEQKRHAFLYFVSRGRSFQVRRAKFVKAREKLKVELLRVRQTFAKPLIEVATYAYGINTTPFIVPLFKVRCPLPAVLCCPFRRDACSPAPTGPCMQL